MLKKVLASVSALALALGMIALVAGPASAHTGTLSVSAVCQNDGTYLVTYSGSTSNVPGSGPGHTATLTVGEIQPVGATPVGAPATVRKGVDEFLARTQADELIVTAMVHDHAARLRSFEILAELAQTKQA